MQTPWKKRALTNGIIEHTLRTRDYGKLLTIGCLLSIRQDTKQRIKTIYQITLSFSGHQMTLFIIYCVSFTRSFILPKTYSITISCISVADTKSDYTIFSGNVMLPSALGCKTVPRRLKKAYNHLSCISLLLTLQFQLSYFLLKNIDDP